MQIGYYPGCWDLLHVGHVRSLRCARGHCDMLLVGVPTDEVIIQDKGRPPIISTNHRAEMLEALMYVDYAVVYTELRFLPELERFKPAKLFVGPQWGNAERHVEAEEFMREIGGDVVRVEILEPVEISSTSIRHACYSEHCRWLEAGHVEAKRRVEEAQKCS